MSNEQFILHTLSQSTLQRTGFVFYFFLLLFSFSSCKTKQKATASEAKDIKPIVDIRSPQYLNKQLKKNEFPFKTLSIKAENKATINNSENQEFNTNIRIKKDSAIWVSINALMGVEVARVLITKDSVKMMNRLNSSFFAGNFTYLNNLLNVDLDYEMIEALLVGNSVDYYDDERLKSSIVENSYILSTVRKRKLKRVLQDGKTLNDPLESLWINPSSYKITRIFLDDFSTNRTFDVTFNDFVMVDSLLMPHKSVYDIKAEKTILLETKYNKVTVNSDVAFPFRIPEKYTPIKQQEK